MPWYDLAQNPQVLRALYPDAPELASVQLIAVELVEDGPAVRLRFDLEAFPAAPPKRWDPAFNRAQLTVAFYAAEDLEIKGWSRENPCTLAVVAAAGRLRVIAAGTGCSIAFRAEFFRIDGVSGYVARP